MSHFLWGNLLNNDYYIYIYLDPRKNGVFEYDGLVFEYEPFYVGKGLGGRYKEHLYECYLNTDPNKYKVNKIRKIKSIGLDPIIIKCFENLDEKFAYDLEEYIIALIGKKENGGPLTNISDGGNCGPVLYGEANGNYGRVFSDEERQRIGLRFRGTKLSDDHKQKISKWNRENGNPFKNKTHSEEIRKHWSEIRKGTRLGQENSFYGKTHSEESRKKMSNARKFKTSKYVYRVTSPDADIYWPIYSLQDFIESNDIGKINNIKYYTNPNKTVYKGWTIEKFLRGSINVDDTNIGS